MGCNHSKTRDVEDNRPVKVPRHRQIIYHEDQKHKSISDDEFMDELFSKSVGSDSEISTEPISQSSDLSTSPINFAMPIDDEELIIESYIKTAVEFRNKGSGVCNLDIQLKKQRPELICVGAFIQSNNKTNKYQILSYDTKLPNSSLKYRPDLILREKQTKVIVHVELDENKHRSYDKIEERLRMDQINQYFAKEKYMTIRFDPTIYSNKVEMAVKFVQLINSIDALISASYRNELIRE